MFDNHCSKCNCDFDVITQLKESQRMGFESKILFCPHCGSKSSQQISTSVGKMEKVWVTLGSKN